MDDVADVYLGSCTMAVKTDGSLWAWGRNSDGELGNGTTVHSSVPVKIMDDVTAVAAGSGYTLAIKADNSLWSWGTNDYGQLGDGSSISRNTPAKIMDDVVSVSAGNRHVMAVKTDGSLWGWGLNDFGQRGAASQSRSVPVRLMEGVASVYAFSYDTIAIKTDGSLWAWGWNRYGQLGDGTEEQRDAPVRITDNAVSVYKGDFFVVAIKSDGSLWSWGRNDHGQLGDGTTTTRLTPVKIMEGVMTPDGFPVIQPPATAPGFPPEREGIPDTATRLYKLGLFRGVGDNADGTPDFALDRTPARHEAVTMLVRLLGKEGDALNGEWTTPFTDVAGWAEPYVGYACANGLTTGTGATTFSGADAITASQYITLVLRALGYSSGSDFEWDSAWELSDGLGFTNGEYGDPSRSFTRGDVAAISYNALTATYKDSDKMLFEILLENGAISREAAGNYITMPLYIDGRKVVSVQSYYPMFTGGVLRECRDNDIITMLYSIYDASDCEEVAAPVNYGSFFNLDAEEYYCVIRDLYFMETAGLGGDVIQHIRVYGMIGPVGGVITVTSPWLIHDVIQNKWYSYSAGSDLYDLQVINDLSNWAVIYSNAA